MTVKPDLTRVWASGAPVANVEDPDVTTPGKFLTGWVAEVPTYQNFNYLQRSMTQALAHFNEHGVGVWDTNTTYPIHGLAKGPSGELYLSYTEDSANDPETDDGSNWGKVSLIVEESTFSKLQLMNPTIVGMGFVCQERDFARYILRDGSYVAKPGDITFANGNTAELIISGVYNVKKFGAKGDGTTIDTTAIQNACDRARNLSEKPQGGGVVYLPKGIYIVDNVIDVYSDVLLLGDGKTLTYIKPDDSATYNANQGIIQTVFFDTTQGDNLWDYYDPYPAGLVMGFGIDQICIDGNRGNVSNANGLCIYGGKWKIGDVAVINTDGHGIWTEAGIPGSSISGDDLHDYLNMHESYGENIYISNANKHGWLYRGPNDSSITDVQIKTCGWGGIFQESTGNNSVGNLEIQSLHAYSCNCLHDANGAMVTLANANVQFLYVDASKRRGLLTNNSATIIDQLFILGNDPSNLGFDAITLDVPTQINMIRNSEANRTSGTAGKFLVVNRDSIIGQLRTVRGGSSTLVQKVVELNAKCNIKNAIIENYNIPGSVAIDVNASKCDVNANLTACDTGIDYNASGRNRIYLNALNCANDIVYNVSVVNSDIIEYHSDALILSEYKVGRSRIRAMSVGKVDVAYSAFITPTPRSYSFLQVNTLTGNVEFLTPTNPELGQILRIQLQQDGTGGRTVTFSTDYKNNYSDTGNTAFARCSIEFYFDGTFWVQNYFSGWF